MSAGAVDGEDRCRLYLITPPAFETEAFANDLRAALDGGDVACLQLRLKDVDDDAVRRATEVLMPLAHASEVAFLAMDLDRYGRRDLSARFVASYLDLSGDKELRDLLDFYRCYRAYVRGKVGCFQYADPHIPEQDKEEILDGAKSYFKLAESYIA